MFPSDVVEEKYNLQLVLLKVYLSLGTWVKTTFHQYSDPFK